jgi:hypothetical protein
MASMAGASSVLSPEEASLDDVIMKELQAARKAGVPLSGHVVVSLAAAACDSAVASSYLPFLLEKLHAVALSPDGREDPASNNIFIEA